MKITKVSYVQLAYVHATSENLKIVNSFMLLSKFPQILSEIENLIMLYFFQVLKNLNALDGEERLTPLGYHLSKLPIDPQAGKMILMAALFSCIDPVLSVAACLSFKDPFFVPLGREDEVHEVKDMFAAGEKSDHFVYIEAMRRWEETYSYGGEFDFSKRSFLSNQTMGLLRFVQNGFILPGCPIYAHVLMRKLILQKYEAAICQSIAFNEFSG